MDKFEKDDMIDSAILIASQVHQGQYDKSGEPYILHALAVMNLAGELYKEDFLRRSVLCSAVLHDVVEDFDHGETAKGRMKDQIRLWCGEHVLDAVEALTKVDGENYLDSYIERISHNWIARIVKIADLTHNMDPSRLPRGEIKDYDFKRWDKYRRALVRLSEVRE